jgi:hypothetical protein
VLCGFKYGPWLATINWEAPGEQREAETSYMEGEILYRGFGAKFLLSSSNNAGKHFRERILEDLKDQAEAQGRTPILAKDMKGFNDFTRVVGDFCFHGVEGGTVSEWTERHNLAPVKKIKPARGPVKPVLIDLGGDYYHVLPSKFLVRTSE